MGNAVNNPLFTTLKLYGVMNKEGKFYRSRGYNGYGDSWVDSLEKAKVYGKPGPAKSQITWWSKNYPDFGVPDLIELEANVVNIISQEKRVLGVIEEQKKAENRREINIALFELKKAQEKYESILKK